MTDFDIGGNLKQVLMLIAIIIFATVSVKTGSNVTEAITGVLGVLAVFTEKAQLFGGNK